VRELLGVVSLNGFRAPNEPLTNAKYGIYIRSRRHCHAFNDAAIAGPNGGTSLSRPTNRDKGENAIMGRDKLYELPGLIPKAPAFYVPPLRTTNAPTPMPHPFSSP